MEERITQVQAEEQCRLLRMKRNAATQQADTVYQKTMQSLFDNYTEELKRLDEKIVTYRYKITTLRTEMAEAWDKAVSEGKDEVRGSMGILMAPYKEKINTYQTKLESVRNERKYLSEHYAHNKRVAVGVRDAALREAQESYHSDRMLVMAKVATKQPEYWREKYEELKAKLNQAG